MLDKAELEQQERTPLRTLPGDDKVRFVVIDCQRQLEFATDSLRRFRDLWFTEGIPDREGARESARELEATAISLRNAVRELLRVCAPSTP